MDLSKSIRSACLSFGNICVGLGSGLCGQSVGVPVGADSALFVADLFLLCYEGDFMKSRTKGKRYDMIDVSIQLPDNLLKIDSDHFERMVYGTVCPTGLWLRRVDASGAEVALLD